MRQLRPQAEGGRAIPRAMYVGWLTVDAEIVRIGWLITRRKMEKVKPQYAELVAKLSLSKAACAIRQGLSLHGEPQDDRYFDGSHRLQQCFNC